MGGSSWEHSCTNAGKGKLCQLAESLPTWFAESDASNIIRLVESPCLVELLRAAALSLMGLIRLPLNIFKNACLAWRTSLVAEAGTDPQLESHATLRRALWQRNRLEIWWLSGRMFNLLLVPGGSFATDFRPVWPWAKIYCPLNGGNCDDMAYRPPRLKIYCCVSANALVSTGEWRYFSDQYAQTLNFKSNRRLARSNRDHPSWNWSPVFSATPRPTATGGIQRPTTIPVLYVSIIDTYKHQWQVAEAVAKLRAEGADHPRPDGSAYPPALQRLQHTAVLIDLQAAPSVTGAPSASQTPWYAAADLGVFASSCSCKRSITPGRRWPRVYRSPVRSRFMPEVLGDALYRSGKSGWHR